MRKRIILAIGLGASFAATLAVPVLAAIAYTLTILNGGATSYENIGLAMAVNNQFLADHNYISGNGLDTRVYDAETEIPWMVTDNATWFVTDLNGFESKSLVYSGGHTAASQMDIIPGYGGYITTEDDNALELGSRFDLSFEMDLDMTYAEDKAPVYKQGAALIDVTADNQLTFHALNANDSDNWTLQATGLASGKHTIRVVNTGPLAELFVDGNSADTQSLLEHNYYQVVAGDMGGAPTTCRPNFYAAGRYWITYSTGGIAYITSSTDGSSWAAGTQLSAAAIQTLVSGYDAATNKYAWAFRTLGDGTGFYNLHFRQGVPQSDGSIAWDAAEQVPGSAPHLIMEMGMDNTGHWWIGGQSGGVMTVTKNANTNGTWAAAAGFPYTLSGQAYRNPYFLFPSTPSGLVIVLDDQGTVKEKFYNGGSWSGTWVSTTFLDIPSDAASDASGNLYVAADDGAGNKLIYMRSAGQSGTWGSAVSLTVGDSGKAMPSLSYNTSDGNIYMFYKSNLTTLRYVSFLGGTYGTPETIATVDSGIIPVAPLTWTDHVGVVANTGGFVKQAFLAYWWTWNNTAYDWYWMLNGSASYATSINMTVSGTPVLRYQPISMIDGDVLPDRAGSLQNGTFHWGVEPMNVDVTSSGGWTPGKRAIYTGGAGSANQTDVLDIPLMPPSMYTEGDTSKFPFGGAIDEILEEGEVPKMLWWLPFIFIGTAIIGLLVYELTTAKGTAKGSLLTMCITMEVCLALFGVLGAAGGIGVKGSRIPLFPAFLAPIPWVAICLSDRHIGWG